MFHKNKIHKNENVFDTENERIGFAESIHTLPGSSIKCNKQDCTGAVTPIPDPD